jgi:hypothetical protein
MNALQRNHSLDVFDIPTDRQIGDSKWVFKIKPVSDGSVDKFKARSLVKEFWQIQEQDYYDTFAPMVHFNSLRLLLSNITANGFVPQQLDIKSTSIYGELKEAIYMHLPEDY